MKYPASWEAKLLDSAVQANHVGWLARMMYQHVASAEYRSYKIMVDHPPHPRGVYERNFNSTDKR
jgi:predicted amidophosphoribosyltransferase